MISGLYTAASGLIAQTEQQDVIANNIANVNTTGYKKDKALFLTFPQVFLHRINDEKTFLPDGTFGQMNVPIGEIGKGVQLRVDGVRPAITEEGTYVNTNNKLDFAIKGNGMFVVSTPNGIRYTRDGAFSLDAEGRVVTKDGHPVLGDAGEIYLNGKNIHVDEAGNIFDGKDEVDTFRVAVFTKDTPLRKEGNNLFYTLDNMPVPDSENFEEVSVLQGYTESSNVNVVREMVDMISAYRAYEASQKAIASQDQTLDKAVNSVGNIQI